MEVGKEKVPLHFLKQVVQRTKLQVCFIIACSTILIWCGVVHFIVMGPVLPSQQLVAHFPASHNQLLVRMENASPLPQPFPPPRNYTSNGYLVVSCNGGLNQMRAAICDMVAIARLLNLTLVVPELDKKSFWADHSDFEDIFDVDHFINSLRDEVRIIKTLPKKFDTEHGARPLVMAPISWSNDKYYLQQILPLFMKNEVVHFNKTDTRLANNGIPLELQRLRCRVNFQALKFTPQIEEVGNKLIHILKQNGPFVSLHLRYEMDMLAFSGCTHGCSEPEAKALELLRYAFPWWKEKVIVSEEKRSQGLCPLTPEETTLILQAFGFRNDTQIHIAAGEIYGGAKRLETLKAAFPKILKKEKLMETEDLLKFQNHSSQMAALDYMISVASDTFIPTYDGNMARVVEGHRRYLGFKQTIQLDRKRLPELVDMYLNKTLSREEFFEAVRVGHKGRMGQPGQRRVVEDKPKEEEYFYANPYECLCNDVLAFTNSTVST